MEELQAHRKEWGIRRALVGAANLTVDVAANTAEALAESTKPKRAWKSQAQQAVEEAKREAKREAQEERQRRQNEKDNKASLSYKMVRRLQENAAKILLVDHAVHHATEDARTEFRIAHPLPLVCEHCNKAFVSRRELNTHSRDRPLHVELLKSKIADEERFAYVDAIFVGEQGRRLRANRLMFSPDLHSLAHRIEIAQEDPYRPYISDPGAKRLKQQLKGSFVQGFDAKGGIRPMFRRMGLVRQHLAPVRHQAASDNLIQVAEPRLRDVLHNLLRCKDDFIDTVSTCDHPMNREQAAWDIRLNEDAAVYSANMQQEIDAQQQYDYNNALKADTKGNEGSHDLKNSHGMCALVKIQWNQFAHSQVMLIGEFTGWQPVEMKCDVRTGMFSKMYQLSPGRYRYRFIMRGQECIDSVASSVADPTSPCGYSNEILVTNTPLFHISNARGKSVVKKSKSQGGKASSADGASRGLQRSLTVDPLLHSADEFNLPLSDGGGGDHGDHPLTSSQLLSPHHRKQLRQLPLKAGERIDTPLQAAAKLQQMKRMGLTPTQPKGYDQYGNLFKHDDLGNGNGNGNISSSPSKTAAYLASRGMTGTPGGGTGSSRGNGREKDSRISFDAVAAPTAAGLSRTNTAHSFQLDEEVDYSPIARAHTARSSAVNLTARTADTCDTAYTAVEMKELGDIVHINRTDKAELIRRLEHIDLRNLALYDDGAWALSSYVSSNSFIKSIDLSYNYISDEGMQAFSACLPKMLALETIKLNGNGFAVDGCRYLCNGLKSCASLKSIELASNRIGDDGMEALCEFLRYNPSVESIHVDSCLIGDDGMDCFHDALVCNRALWHISLAGNKIGPRGASRLARALEFNSSLRDINLNYNPLGPEGVKSVGDLIAVSDTVAKVELVNVGMVNSGSTYGLAGLCFGIKNNKSMTALVLRNNNLTDMHATTIAHALTANTVLASLDVAGNRITQKWLTKDTYIHTHILREMPSLETSLDINRKHAKEGTSDAHKYDVVIRMRTLDDVAHGRWNNRRQWRREQQSQDERLQRRMRINEEHERIEAEVEYISSMLANWMRAMQLYMQEAPCRNYIKAVTKFITQYMHDLAQFDPELYNQERLSMERMRTLKSAQSRRQQSVKLKESAAATSPSARSRGGLGIGMASNKMRRKQELMEETADVEASLSERSPSIDHFPAPGQLSRSISTISLGGGRGVGGRGGEGEGGHSSGKVAARHLVNVQNIDSFLNAHISVVNAVFQHLDGGEEFGRTTLMISPHRLSQAFQMLSVPMPDAELQNAVDATLVSSTHTIGLHKFSEYVLLHARRLSKQNSFQRMRILADLALHPPVLEAEAIVLDQLRHMFVGELRANYRAMPGNKPLFACAICQKRFATQRQYDKHMARGERSKDHRRHKVKEVIHHSQVMFLQQVKWSMTGVFFPAYYELKPNYLLPKHYVPQIVDKIGSEGRPLGVVEPQRTIRVLDVFGEYLHVSHEGALGWIRYRSGSKASKASSKGGAAGAAAAVVSKEYMQPVCAGKEGFDWDKLHIQEDLTYYRVNDSLPDGVELKIRHLPTQDGEVVGYLHRNEVIECMAVIGDWLQVRFENEDGAWVRWRPPNLTRDAKIVTDESIQKAIPRIFTANSGPADAGGSVSGAVSGRRTQTSRSFGFSLRSLTSGAGNDKGLGGGEGRTASPSRQQQFSARSALTNPFRRGGSIESSSLCGGDSMTLQSAGAAGTMGVLRGSTMSPSRAYQAAAATAASSNRAKTPGERNEELDRFFNDNLITYEINGKFTKINTKKHPNVSKLKIDYFSKVRYGSSVEGTSQCTLLLLPRHIQHGLINPPDLTDTSGTKAHLQAAKRSPLVVTQQQLFDHIMSCAEYELMGPVQHAETDRPEFQDLFLHTVGTGGGSSPGSSPTRDKAKQGAGQPGQPEQPGRPGKLNRFGYSEKDDVYGFADASDKVAESGMRLHSGGHDDAFDSADEQELANLQEYSFPRRRH